MKFPLYFQYYVAFFDAKGDLVGCESAGQIGKDGVGPGK